MRTSRYPKPSSQDRARSSSQTSSYLTTPSAELPKRDHGVDLAAIAEQTRLSEIDRRERIQRSYFYEVRARTSQIDTVDIDLTDLDDP